MGGGGFGGGADFSDIFGEFSAIFLAADVVVNVRRAVLITL